MRITDTYRTVRGVLRSLNIYYRNGRRRDAMDALHRRFVRSGDLVFDVGAHVGDRIGSFLRLGARVVAVEPQPALVKTLKLLYRAPRVIIEPVAVGSTAGSTDFRLNLDNPTVSTASDAFIASAAGAPGWQGQFWTRTITVAVTTLDALIARHGMPAFIKLDVEGFEAEALTGLTQPVRALSFEFTTIQRDLALACVQRCAELGYVSYNAALGESQTLVHTPLWCDAQGITAWLHALPTSANSGDIYALRGNPMAL